MSYKSFREIYEARKNPELNPKVSAYEALKPYSDDPDVYISFTQNFEEGNKSPASSKIGINPKSKFNTPLGIFSYNLKESWDFYNVDWTKSLTVLPFAADRPNIYILRAKNVGASFVNDMYTDYGSNDYDRDIITLNKIWYEEAPKSKMFVSYDFSKAYKDIQDKIKYYDDLLKEIDDLPEFTEEDTQYKKVTKPKYVYKHKQSQDALKGLDLERERVIIKDLWQELVQYSLDTAKVQNSIMSFWNLTRLMAIKLSGSSKGISMATKWNWILRKCGYSGFADKSGRGYIHPSEPQQAVFLTRNAFEVIDKIQNKDYIGKGIRTLEDINTELFRHTKIGYIVDTISYLSGDRNDPLLKITDTADNIISGADYLSFKGFLRLVLKYAQDSNGINESFYKRLQKILSKYITTHHTAQSESVMFNQLMVKIKDEVTE